MKEQYSNIVEKTLLIVVENFGLNFSGGSSATAMSAEYFERFFKEVVVICANEGRHNLSKAKFVSYTSSSEMMNLIKRHADEKTIGFGDFHMAYPLVNCEMPYFFVYHDNWPEMKNFTLQGKEKGDEIIGKYGEIFANAEEVFSVTEYKMSFIQEYSSKVSLVRNGLSQAITKRSQKRLDKGKMNVLMAGNIDHRKYSKAIEVFQALKDGAYKGIEIDILGLVKEDAIKEKLMAFDFVNFKGFADEVRFIGYDLYLNTSLIENLSLSVVDALANKTPVVSFDVGGIKEVLKGCNGVVVEAFDVQLMAKKLVDIKNGEISFQVQLDDIEEFDWERGAIQMLDKMQERLDYK